MKYVILLIFILAPIIATSPLCNLCRNSINSFYQYMTSNSSMESILTFGKWACTFFQTKKYCDAVVVTFKPTIGAVLELLNGTILCSKFHFCKYPIITVDSDRKYLSRILRSVPPRQSYPNILNVSGTFKILVFTDAHVDFGYREGKSSKCEFTSCCRYDSPDTNNTERRAGKFGYLGKCDLPQTTLDSFIKEVGKINPDVVLWLGDNPAHNTYEQKKSNHLDVLNYISSNLASNYSGPIYFVTGNHDGLPDGQFDVRHGTNQWILDGYAKVASRWYSNEGIETMRKYGRFSELVKGTKLRIIGLNNFVMDYTNIFLFANATDSLGQLKWLENELRVAEEKNEFVITIGHVAPQCKSGERTWGLRYTALMERYANIVKGQFFGHIHEDYFYLTRSFMDPSKIINVVQIHPSLTTFSSLNPSFRVYEMDKDTYDLIDYKQYRMYVNDATKRGIAIWNISYTFKDYYNAASMASKNFELIVNKMMQNHESYKKIYKIHYAV